VQTNNPDVDIRRVPKYADAIPTNPTGKGTGLEIWKDDERGK